MRPRDKISVKLQGWPKRFKLAQDFACKPLLTASSWPNFWANPVTFTRALGVCARCGARAGRSGERASPQPGVQVVGSPPTQTAPGASQHAAVTTCGGAVTYRMLHRGAARAQALKS